MIIPLSILDLSPVASGSTSTQALHNTLELARLADRLGYTRYWLAEHHNIPGVASTTPEIMIGQVARETTRIRVGSGGVMLPNHTPLKVAESFRMLEALFPGRIDLGIGRAPGTDPVTAMALRRSPEARGADDFPEQMGELIAFGAGDFPAGHPFRSVRAVPDDVALPPIWLLGSSYFGAQFAAALGLGFAFAHHINPDDAAQAIRLYREHFALAGNPDPPRVIIATSAICADTDSRAEELSASLDLVWVRLRSGRPGLLPSPEEARAYPYTEAERALVRAYRGRHSVGSPATVRARLYALVEQTGADEVMVMTTVHSHADRLRSYELLAEVFELRPDSAGDAA